MTQLRFSALGLFLAVFLCLQTTHEFYPAQARRLRQWAPEDGEYRPDTLTQSYEELNYLNVNGSIDEILALRSKYPALNDEIMMRAISRAENDGDLERAEKIAHSYALQRSGLSAPAQRATRVLQDV